MKRYMILLKLGEHLYVFLGGSSGFFALPSDGNYRAVGSGTNR
jgi:hypothetical protein